MRKITAVVLSCAALASCQDDRPDPQFKDGQMVRMKVSGAEGMVVFGWCTKMSICLYSVRFPAMQLTTGVRLMGPDQPIQFAPVSLVGDIREFELEAIR